MSPTSVIDFAARKKAKQEIHHTQLKPIKKLTREQMISSNNKKRREE